MGPGVWDLGKPISTAMAEVSGAKLKDKKNEKVQSSSGAIFSLADSKEGARPTQ